MAEGVDMPRDRLRNFVTGVCTDLGEAGLHITERVDMNVDPPVRRHAGERPIEPYDAVAALRRAFAERLQQQRFRGELLKHLVELAKADRILVAAGEHHAPIMRRERSFEHDIAEPAGSGMDRERQRLLRFHAAAAGALARLAIKPSSFCFFCESQSVRPRSVRSRIAALAMTCSSTRA